MDWAKRFAFLFVYPEFFSISKRRAVTDLCKITCISSGMIVGTVFTELSLFYENISEYFNALPRSGRETATIII